MPVREPDCTGAPSRRAGTKLKSVPASKTRPTCVLSICPFGNFTFDTLRPKA